ncbi:hypothetical protein Taro_036044 [Colocasia esculenta]|uniref:Uncharacterized protein n=1 Tax=Colocasia esculenta TaxID=4460 RepID=A0A843WGM0_COLES|nr:hypothetical protein [Colocasia esculenta]
MSSLSGVEPPPFQEASRCDVCKCSFNTFRRRVRVRQFFAAYDLLLPSPPLSTPSRDLYGFVQIVVAPRLPSVIVSWLLLAALVSPSSLRSRFSAPDVPFGRAGYQNAGYSSLEKPEKIQESQKGSSNFFPTGTGVGPSRETVSFGGSPYMPLFGLCGMKGAVDYSEENGATIDIGIYLFSSCSTIVDHVGGLCAMNTLPTNWHFLNMGFIRMSEYAMTALTTLLVNIEETKVNVISILNHESSRESDQYWIVARIMDHRILGKDDSPGTPNLVGATADDMSRLDIGDGVDAKSGTAMESPMLATPDCKCGMPLCICEAAFPDPVPEVKKVDIPAAQSNPRPRKATSMQRTTESVLRNAASSSSKPSTFFNVGPANRGSMDQAHAEYEVNGEGLREAIKNSDAKAVRRLLNQGVDPNYCDKQGLSLLHLAAVFNQTEIVFILMEQGASVECKNAQGETPLDCAPTMLQYKMRQKIEEKSSPGASVPSSG